MKTEAARCASEIRKELKAAFPGVKFSVRSEVYSMGSSVRVRWEDGPIEEAVKAITAKYEYGHFDGMTDMYEYSNSRDDIPQAKYIFEDREMSERTREFLEEWVKARFDLDEYKWDARYEEARLVRDEFRKWKMPERMFEV